MARRATKKKRVKKSRKSVEQIRAQTYGDEPHWEDTEFLTEEEVTSKIGSAFNWYAQNASSSTHHKWFFEWLKKADYTKDEIKALKARPKKSFYRFECAVARLLANGAPIAETQIEKHKKTVQNWIREGEQILEDKDEDSSEDKPNIQDRVKAITIHYCSELEPIIDTFIAKNCRKTDFEMYAWLKTNQVKALHAKRIADWMSESYEEVVGARDNSDEQLSEGYSFLSKPQLKRLVDFYATIIDDCNKWADNQNRSRGPRKRKAITAKDLIKQLKYKKSDDTYKLVSINPENLLETSYLWVFNTHNRRLALYVAKDGGFQLKGSTLQNWNLEESHEKTIRKPNEVLPTVVQKGIRASQKRFNEIKAKKKTLTGRINSHCILVRALR
ncbi:MAG TPA: hypothetical protein DHN29_01680 [Cytophagales bacterium]|nr:hypothetical protein [Cytophagales bacterium]